MNQILIISIIFQVCTQLYLTNHFGKIFAVLPLILIYQIMDTNFENFEHKKLIFPSQLLVILIIFQFCAPFHLTDQFGKIFTVLPLYLIYQLWIQNSKILSIKKLIFLFHANTSNLNYFPILYSIFIRKIILVKYSLFYR